MKQSSSAFYTMQLDNSQNRFIGVAAKNDGPTGTQMFSIAAPPVIE